jgi:predicted outer membrane protein
MADPPVLLNPNPSFTMRFLTPSKVALGWAWLAMQASASLAGATEAPAASEKVPLDAAIVDFLRENISTRLAVIEIGRLAQTQHAESAAGMYAKGMISEESLLLERLQALAQAVGVSVSTNLGEKYAKKIAKFQTLPPAEFERSFWNFVTDVYQDDLLAYEFASKADNPQIREFAVQYRSMFERQLGEIAQRKKSAG